MVKRWCAALLCTLLAVSLTGCGSLLNREWYEVKDHSPTYYEGEGRDVLRADTYQDLVNNILIFVGNHAEEGTICEAGRNFSRRQISSRRKRGGICNLCGVEGTCGPV